MNGESKSAADEALDRAVIMVRMVWFGLFASAVTVSVTLAAIRLGQADGVVDPGPLGYVFLGAVPVVLAVAYLVVPLFAPTDVAATVARQRKRDPKAYPLWERATPDDAYHWFPLYSAGAFARVGLLEAGVILAAVGFFLTGSWVVLGAAAVPAAALLLEVPTRGAAESFAARSRANRTE